MHLIFINIKTANELKNTIFLQVQRLVTFVKVWTEQDRFIFMFNIKLVVYVLIEIALFLVIHIFSPITLIQQSKY